jgi:hypothetical protein
MAAETVVRDAGESDAIWMLGGLYEGAIAEKHGLELKVPAQA